MPPQRGGARTRRPAGLLRSEEHTSELQSPCNLVCRIIISKEHTSELQSPCNLVCRLLLEKKNKGHRLFLVTHSSRVSSDTYMARSSPHSRIRRPRHQHL